MGFAKWPAVLALAASLMTGAAAAQPPSAPTPAGYTLPETEVWDMPREGDAEPYRIFVSKPEGAPPPGGFPVLYVLDGNSIFATFADARRLQKFASPPADQVIIVGVGYPTDQPFDLKRRLYDLTPPPPAQTPPSQQGMTGFKAGGQDRLQAFLLDQLRPEIAKRYPVNPARQALFGHSLGGLFALHVLYTRPDAFSAIVAASPSQWWDDQALLAEERAFTEKLKGPKRPHRPAKVLVLVGEQEDQSMVGDAQALGLRLAPLSAYGLRSRFELLDNENHMSAPTRAVTTALRFVMGRL